MRKRVSCLMFGLLVLAVLSVAAQTTMQSPSDATSFAEILGYWQSIARSNTPDGFINPSPEIYIIISKDTENNFYLSQVGTKEYQIIEIDRNQYREYGLLLVETNEDGGRLVGAQEYRLLLKMGEKNKAILVDSESECFQLDKEVIEIMRLAGPKAD